MKFCTLTNKEFSKFESRSPYGNIMQTVERSMLREKMGYGCHLVGVKEKDTVIAAALIVVKGKDAWIQIGPILDWDNIRLVKFFIENATNYCREQKYNEIEIFPPVLYTTRDTHGEKIKEFKREKIFDAFSSAGYKHLGFTEKTEYKALRWMFVKDLTGCKDLRDIELTFDSTRRKRFHRAQRTLEVYKLQDKSELETWIMGLKDSDKRNGLNTRQLQYFRDMWDCYGDKVMFLEAKRIETGEIVACEVDIWHENELVTFLSGIPAEFRKENGMTAIKGWQMEECLKRKIYRVNMYGIEGNFTSSNSLLTTKKDFGGYVEEYIGGFKLVLNKRAYMTDKVCRKIGSLKKKVLGK
jgi:lipid II:glycine glycyltransferase (peptidoglycan interpeptide bridge formation enzyme)